MLVSSEAEFQMYRDSTLLRHTGMGGGGGNPLEQIVITPSVSAYVA
jgi:hypothetical protein